MWLAREAGHPTRLADRLFTAYFTEGLDLSGPAMLKRIGGEAGLPPERVAGVIDKGEGTADVRGLEAHAHHLGIRSVPLMRIGNAVISGARSTSVLAAALPEAARAERADAV